jgi:bifunctional ADP-heptose synthase (sugar kinase/adenylyltransferase)
MSLPLSQQALEAVLGRLAGLTIGVLGDLFLDRYLDIDAALTEPSLETGLDAYQVVRVRSYAGAAGTVINNLAALGVGRIVPVAVIGDDGEGHELRQALDGLGVVDASGVLTHPGRRTPTYTKPMLCQQGAAPRELNRLDILNRTPLPAGAQDRLLESLRRAWPALDGLVVLDQVSQPDCGVVTAQVRDAVAALARATPARPVLADSREQIGLFRHVCLKPNQRECLRAAGASAGDLAAAVRRLAAQAGGVVFCTRAEAGILIARPGADALEEAPAFVVSGPVDPVGAGDSTSAGIVCALASGRTPVEAAALGCLVASITVQQIGTTGTATPAQVRQRYEEASAGGA